MAENKSKLEAMADALRGVRANAAAGSTVANLAYQDAYNQHVLKAAQAGNAPIPYPDFQRLMQYRELQAQQAQNMPMMQQSAMGR